MSHETHDTRDTNEVASSYADKLRPPAWMRNGLESLPLRDWLRPGARFEVEPCDVGRFLDDTRKLAPSDVGRVATLRDGDVLVESDEELRARLGEPVGELVEAGQLGPFWYALFATDERTVLSLDHGDFRARTTSYPRDVARGTVLRDACEWARAHLDGWSEEVRLLQDTLRTGVTPATGVQTT